MKRHTKSIGPTTAKTKNHVSWADSLCNSELLSILVPAFEETVTVVTCVAVGAFGFPVIVEAGIEAAVVAAAVAPGSEKPFFKQ